jgi:DnaJ family protein C protein 28
MPSQRPQPAGGDGDENKDIAARRLRQALDKAADYHKDKKEEGGAETTEKDAPVLMTEWSDLVSQRIEDAMRRGAFDNLAGKGKPLDLEQNPFVPANQQTASRLLKNNDLVPEWIAARREVLSARDRLRNELKQAVAAIRQQMDEVSDVEERARLSQSWKRWLNAWHSRMEDLNYRIMIQNLKQPVRHLEIYQLLLRDELVRAGADAAWQFDLR